MFFERAETRSMAPEMTASVDKRVLKDYKVSLVPNGEASGGAGLADFRRLIKVLT